jgi:hypothetical protein
MQLPGAAPGESREHLIDVVVRQVLTPREISGMSAHGRCDCFECRLGVARVRGAFREMSQRSRDYVGPSFRGPSGRGR